MFPGVTSASAAPSADPRREHIFLPLLEACSLTGQLPTPYHTTFIPSFHGHMVLFLFYLQIPLPPSHKDNCEYMYDSPWKYKMISPHQGP